MDSDEINAFVSENTKTIFAYALSRVSDKYVRNFCISGKEAV